MKHVIAVAGVLALTGPALGQSPTLMCHGSNPGWALDLLGNQAQFRFAHKTLNFDIPQAVVAEGRGDPIAITLLAQTDTAVVLVEEEHCQIADQVYTHEIQVLTQRRQIPILLSGCCRALP